MKSMNSGWPILLQRNEDFGLTCTVSVALTASQSPDMSILQFLPSNVLKVLVDSRDTLVEAERGY